MLIGLGLPKPRKPEGTSAAPGGDLGRPEATSEALGGDLGRLFSWTGRGKRPSQARNMGPKYVFSACLSRKSALFCLPRVILRAL